MTWWAGLGRFRATRVLSPAEYGWAAEVFGATLPARERIRTSPALGLKRRPFTFPRVRGGATMYLGANAAEPVRSAPALFAHELTHVWQVHHARNRLVWLAGAVVTQLRYSSGRDVYDVGDATLPWADYTIEQQATIVERWVAHRHDPEGERLQHYLDDDVRAAGER